jgi:glycosyltransferase involved in cell wall biosynthesis
VEGQATAEAKAVAPDDELRVRLEVELPERLAVGRGTVVFVYGSCFHRRHAVEDLRILLDERSVEPMAQRMPRRDLHEALRAEDPNGHAYRSGFWGLVPIEPLDRPRTARIRVAARLNDGSEQVADLAMLELEPEVATDPAPWREGGESDEPLVAICMATYDPPIELFRRQIDSIREQTHPNWVCAISDDHSPHERFAELEAIVGGDPRFRISRAPRRLGFYGNFERALSMVPEEARYVTLSDQDDRWAPDKLEVLVGSLGDAQLTYSDARVVSGDGRLISETYWSRRRTNHSNLASLLISNTITGAAALFRRELLDRVLPFPPELGTQWHDHWIALVALATGDVRYVDRPLYDYVQHRDAVIGHSVANPDSRRRGLGERVRRLRGDWRAVFGGWCWKYFYGVCRVLLLARVLELRCGESLAPRKRRAVKWFVAIDRSPLALAWLWMRRLRGAAGLNETLGGERLFLDGLAWRRLLSLATWRRGTPSPRLLKDASLPPAGSSARR